MSQFPSLRSIVWEGIRKYITIILIVFGSVLSVLEYLYGLSDIPIFRVFAVLVVFLLGLFIYLFVSVTRLLASFSKQKAKEFEAFVETRRKYESAFGFRNLQVRSERELTADGGVKATQAYEVEDTGGGLTSRMHFQEAIGTRLDELDYHFKVTALPEGHRVIDHLINGMENRIRIDVQMSPPLHKGDVVGYEISANSKNTFIMTKEQLLDKIRAQKWILDEPYEYSKFIVITPIEKLTHTVVFPYGYSISGGRLFNVTVGESNFECPAEIERLTKANAFSQNEIVDENGDKRTALLLNVGKPLIGMSYWIKWIPMAETRYRKLLEQTNMKK